jgi:hypothetical protein
MQRLLFLLVFVLSLASTARAEPNEADRATARALALEGHKALQAKDYQTAADRFGRADALVHAPTLVVDLARALTGLGRYVAAHEKYELVLREGVPANAPKSWLRALEDAKREVEAIKPKLAWVTVILKDPPDATVTIDGAVVPPAAIGVRRAADPGSPAIRVEADGYAPFEQTVSVGPGEETSIDVTLERLPDAPAPIEPARVAQDTSAPPSNTRRILTYVALGVGGAGIVVGSVTGVLALGKRSDLNKVCRDSDCPSSEQGAISDYRQYGTISGIGFGVGVAGIGTGLVLLLTQPKSGETPSAAAGLSVKPLVGFGSVGAEGTF